MNLGIPPSLGPDLSIAARTVQGANVVASAPRPFTGSGAGCGCSQSTPQGQDPVSNKRSAGDIEDPDLAEARRAAVDRKADSR